MLVTNSRRILHLWLFVTKYDIICDNKGG